MHTTPAAKRHRLRHLGRVAACLTAAIPMLGPAMASSPEAECATVEVHNVRPGQGHLMLAAYDSAQAFAKQSISSLRVPASEAVMRLQLCGLKGDTVALMLFQDLDSDGRMGRNMLGMPTEPWGSSGTPGTFGPSWDNARVSLNGQPVVVRMSQ